MKYMKLGAVIAAFGIASVGVVATAGPASANIPAITASCAGVTASATHYAPDSHNQLGVTVGSVSKTKDFPDGGADSLTVQVPQDGKVYNWSAYVHSGGDQATKSDHGTVGPCGESNGDTKKIEFCHATGSESNPFVLINTSVNAFYSAGHIDHKGDIWPAFSYLKKGETINVPAQGDQALLANGCVVTPHPDRVTRESRDQVTKVSCSAGVVTEQHQTRTGTSKWDAEKKEYGPVVYSEWTNDGSPKDRPATAEECPPPPPPTNAKCSTYANGGTSTNLNPNGWSDIDTRSAGHHEYVADGLHIYTDDASSNAKVSMGKAVSFDLKQTGLLSLDYTATSGIKPGLNLFVTFAPGQTGTLVYEDVYGQDLWLTNGSNAAVKANAPSHTGGNGSDNHGTIDQWLTRYPDAHVTGIAFSLGSGVHADGVLHSLNVGCAKYSFGYEKPAKPAPVVTTTTNVGKPDCDKHTVTTTTTTTTTDWVFTDGAWVKGEPKAVTTSTSRETTAEECPVETPPVQGPPGSQGPPGPAGTPGLTTTVVTPAAAPLQPAVYTAAPALPKTGDVDLSMVWAGLAALIAGAGALALRRKIA